MKGAANKWISFTMFIVILVSSSFGVVQAYQVTLAWNPVNDPQVIGYEVHWGTESRRYTNHSAIYGRLNNTCRVMNLNKGEVYYFAVTAFDGNGNSSVYSEELGHPESGLIILGSANQQMHFTVNSDGSIRGLSSAIKGEKIFPENIRKVYASSDRVGRLIKIGTKTFYPSASGVFDVINQSAQVQGTANNDSPISWFVLLTNGEMRWLNTDTFKFDYNTSTMPSPQAPVVKLGTVGGSPAVKYGNYANPLIVFNESAIVINFGSNRIGSLQSSHGPVYGLNPKSVARVKWNSDKVGWLANSSAVGTISRNRNGNLYAVIRPALMPSDDRGLLSVELFDGTELIFFPDKFRLSPNARFWGGMIEYDILP